MYHIGEYKKSCKHQVFICGICIDCNHLWYNILQKSRFFNEPHCARFKPDYLDLAFVGLSHLYGKEVTKGTVLFVTKKCQSEVNHPQWHLFTNFAAEYGKGITTQGRAAVRI